MFTFFLHVGTLRLYIEKIEMKKKTSHEKFCRIPPPLWLIRSPENMRRRTSNFHASPCLSEKETLLIPPQSFAFRTSPKSSAYINSVFPCNTIPHTHIHTQPFLLIYLCHPYTNFRSPVYDLSVTNRRRLSNLESPSHLSLEQMDLVKRQLSNA